MSSPITTPSVRPASIRRQWPIIVLWASSLVSIFGNTLTAIAVPWFVLETTGSASRTGITAAITVIPLIIAMFLGGALVDRVSYKGLSVMSDLASAVTVAAIPVFSFTTGLSFGGLLVLMFLGAMLDGPGGTARMAMVPPLSAATGVPIERINANFGMIQAASGLFAAPFAGLMIAWFGPVDVLWFNAGTFLFSALMVLAFIPRIQRVAEASASFLGDVRAGITYVMNQRLIRTLIFGALSINFLMAPMFGVAIPWFANQELQSVRSLGIMMGGEALGALVGAFLYGRFSGVVPRRTFLVAALLLIALPLFPLTFASTLPVAATSLAVLGMGSGMVNPMIVSFLHLSTPSALIGRVIGIFASGAMLAQPLGFLLGGVLISQLGYRESML
ncbi:MAG TPA: MFS transporter, partial [Thermomicrobiales bacterium]|nr:MFS transporter [Thermomicrobiales bacterium]